jgi:DNA-binding response OmpR family regulator
MVQSTIALIWDDRDEASMFKLAFEEAGYRMHVFEDANVGFTMCVHYPPDTLILKRHLQSVKQKLSGCFESDIDGLELCQKLRAVSGLQLFPIVVGFADVGTGHKEELYQQAYTSGANACFDRVYDISDVISQVKTLLA